MANTIEAGLVELLSVLTFKPLIKVGGGLNPNFLFLILNKIFFSFDVIAKQTPYRYSADAKEIIQYTHDFCKREKEGGLKISLNQVKERASTAT